MRVSDIGTRYLATDNFRVIRVFAPSIQQYVYKQLFDTSVTLDIIDVGNGFSSFRSHLWHYPIISLLAPYSIATVIS